MNDTVSDRRKNDLFEHKIFGSWKEGAKTVGVWSRATEKK